MASKKLIAHEVCIKVKQLGGNERLSDPLVTLSTWSHKNRVLVKKVFEFVDMQDIDCVSPVGPG